jgi:hypothetical protein
MIGNQLKRVHLQLIKPQGRLKNLFKCLEVGVLVKDRGIQPSAVQRVMQSASFIDVEWSEQAGSPSRGASEKTVAALIKEA